MTIKASYNEIIESISKIMNAFNLSQDQVSVWFDVINSTGITASLLKERTDELLSSWDNESHYGKPTPADLVKGYENTTTQFSCNSVYHILRSMITDRIPSEHIRTETGEEYDIEEGYYVYVPDLYNAMLHILFKHVTSEDGRIKRDKEGKAVFELTEEGKYYAKEIQQRANYNRDCYFRGFYIDKSVIDHWREIGYSNASAEIKDKADKGHDYLVMPYEVVKKTKNTEVEYVNYYELDCQHRLIE